MVGTMGVTGGGSGGRMSAEDQARLWGEIAANPERYKENLEGLIAATRKAEASEKAARERLEKAERQEADAQAKLDALDRLTTERQAEHAGMVAALDQRQSNLDGLEARLKTMESELEARQREVDAATAQLANTVATKEQSFAKRDEALRAAESRAAEAQEEAETLVADYEGRLTKLRAIVNGEPGP